MTQKEFKAQYKSLIEKVKDYNKTTQAKLKEISKEASRLRVEFQNLEENKALFYKAVKAIKEGKKRPLIYDCDEVLEALAWSIYEGYYFKQLPIK